MGITGLGPAGLVAAQYAAAEGASEVVGFDLSPARRERGLEVGLDSAWDPRDVLPQFPARPSRPAFTCGVDCVGARASVEFLMDRVQDTVALFGVQREDYVYATRHYDGLRLCGYKGHSRSAARYAVEHLERGALDLTKLVTHHFPLEQYDEAVTLLEKQEAVKVCFWPWR
jgi:threonine 3-dehydrogenase